jgi:hypothetical protein
LEEAGASRYESGSRNRRNLRRTEDKEARGRTAQQEREGKSHIGAYRKRESTKAMAGRDARKPTSHGRKAAAARSRRPDGHTRQELYAKAKRKGIEGRSRMSKRQLENALRRALNDLGFSPAADRCHCWISDAMAGRKAIRSAAGESRDGSSNGCNRCGPFGISVEG